MLTSGLFLHLAAVRGCSEILAANVMPLFDYGTRNATLLERVPVGVTTLPSPVVARAGTVVVISVFDTT
jgi:hypothetical protein